MSGSSSDGWKKHLLRSGIGQFIDLQRSTVSRKKERGQSWSWRNIAIEVVAFERKWCILMLTLHGGIKLNERDVTQWSRLQCKQINDVPRSRLSPFFFRSFALNFKWRLSNYIWKIVLFDVHLFWGTHFLSIWNFPFVLGVCADGFLVVICLFADCSLRIVSMWVIEAGILRQRFVDLCSVIITSCVDRSFFRFVDAFLCIVPSCHVVSLPCLVK